MTIIQILIFFGYPLSVALTYISVKSLIIALKEQDEQVGSKFTYILGMLTMVPVLNLGLMLAVLGWRNNKGLRK